MIEGQLQGDHPTDGIPGQTHSSLGGTAEIGQDPDEVSRTASARSFIAGSDTPDETSTGAERP